MKKRKKFSLKEEYKKSWNFIKESKKFIFSIIIIFFVFLLIGLFIPMPSFLSDMITNFLKDLVKETQSLSAFQLIWFIFFNNLQVSFFGIILGLLFFGIIPVFLAVMNGYILGFVFSISIQQQGILSLWKIFPHGIFELPAVFISLGMGLRLGTLIFKKKQKFKEFFRDSARVFILIIIPLLIIAGIIEGMLISFLR
ncbi:MAG TPA: stage II sporulation protein M [Patescibacteria group bacterium]|nr:stage II sporulation protein M [Patescibacteria group bacterium]